MIEELFNSNKMESAVGVIYIFIGITGSLCNMVTLLVITCYRVYRLSAYTIMANLALADAIMLIIVGLVCGLNIAQVPFATDNNTINNSIEFLNNSKLILNSKFNKIFDYNNKNQMIQREMLKINEITSELYNANRSQFNTILEDLHFSIFLLSFLEIAAWTAGIISYALLGVNRCVAICFYRTRARAINRVSFALLGSTMTWLIGIIAGSFLLLKF